MIDAIGGKADEFLEDRIAHLGGADLAGAFGHDVAGSDALIERVGNRLFEDLQASLTMPKE